MNVWAWGRRNPTHPDPPPSLSHHCCHISNALKAVVQPSISHFHQDLLCWAIVVPGIEKLCCSKLLCWGQWRNIAGLKGNNNSLLLNMAPTRHIVFRKTSHILSVSSCLDEQKILWLVPALVPRPTHFPLFSFHNGMKVGPAFLWKASLNLPCN